MLSHSSIQNLLYANKAIQFCHRRRSEPISAHIWVEIGSNNLPPAPERIGGRRGPTPRIARFVPICYKKVGTRLSVFMGFSGRLFQLFQFSASPLYNKYIYRDPFLYSFFRALGLKIIGTNGTFTGNAHYYGKKYVTTPILRIVTTRTNGTISGKNPHK